MLLNVTVLRSCSPSYVAQRLPCINHGCHAMHYQNHVRSIHGARECSTCFKYISSSLSNTVAWELIRCHTIRIMIHLSYSEGLLGSKPPLGWEAFLKFLPACSYFELQPG